MAEALVAYLHFAATMTTGAALFVEVLRCNQEMQPPDIRVLAKIDRLYFISAIVVLATGLARVFLVGKGASFYSHNPVFYIKLALFGITLRASDLAIPALESRLEGRRRSYPQRRTNRCHAPIPHHRVKSVSTHSADGRAHGAGNRRSALTPCLFSDER
jgi:hypothetical protein